MQQFSIAFDVGGQYMKSAILDRAGDIVVNSYAVFPSRSKESKDTIIDHLIDMIKLQVSKITIHKFELAGIGYAFPGPFDYENGISFVKDIDKFDQLYGVNIHNHLMHKLTECQTLRNVLSNDFRIVFCNDASLFALGEYNFGHARGCTKSIFLTIGTGAGSAFIENGHLITNRADVPPSGWIYNQPFELSIIDDYISQRGLLTLARSLGIPLIDQEIRTLARMAEAHDPRTLLLFQMFGSNIGRALNPYIHRFKPEAVVIGGQIAKSSHLFIEGIYQTLADKHVRLAFSEETSLSTFRGIAILLQQ